MSRTRYQTEDWERLRREAELDGSREAMLRLLREATRLERPVLRDTPALWETFIPRLDLGDWRDIELLVAYARAARDLDAQRALWAALHCVQPLIQDGEQRFAPQTFFDEIHAFTGEPLALARPTHLPLLWDAQRARRFLEPWTERWTERLTEHCPGTDVFLEAFIAFSDACGAGTGRRAALKHAHSQAKRGLSLVRSRVRQRRDAFFGVRDAPPPELGDGDAAEDWARALVEATRRDIETGFTRAFGFGLRADLTDGLCTPTTTLARDFLRAALGFLPEVLVAAVEDNASEDDDA